MKRIKIISVAVIICVLTGIAAVQISGGAISSDDTVVGAWYDTWYAKTLTQVWTTGHGFGSTNQLMGDVNGDGKEDAVVIFSNGDWYAATSTGTSFNSYTQWATGFEKTTTSQFLADVNGDGKADAVGYIDGTWLVALSNGFNFDAPTAWTAGHGIGSSKQLMDDIDGDGKADAVVYFSSGDWYVAISTGIAFGDDVQWAFSLGSPSTDQFLGDVNGDLKADAVTYNNSLWVVGISNGTAFETGAIWVGGHGSGSSSQLLGDVSGDGKADAVVYFSSGGLSGDWLVCNSTGNSFESSYYTLQKNYALGADKRFIANCSGQSSEQACAFFSTGEWWARCGNFNQYNTWEAWNIKYVPYSLGSYQTYDSGDTAVIDEHLAMMADAKIDFLLLDQTNHLYVDNSYIFDRAKAIAARIRVWNSNPAHRTIKYAIAIGEVQYTNKPASIEYEAGEVINQFVNTVDGGPDNYFYKDGKPLLVSYCIQSLKDDWNTYTGSKTNANKFTLRWAHTPSTGGSYGWEIRDGSISNDEVMVVMPGWNNHKDAGYPVVLRNNGRYYSNSCWDRVLSRTLKPEIVMITSFNDYAEDTAIAPADTSNLESTSEKWYNENGVINNFLYWYKTKSYIEQLHGVASKYIEVTGVTLNTAVDSITVGQKDTLLETIMPVEASYQDIIWTTSNSAVATVDRGVVTAVAEGNAVITATTKDGGYSATCNITVKPLATFGSYSVSEEIINVLPDTTAYQFCNEIGLSKNVLPELKAINGATIPESDLVGTGSIITLISGTITKSYTIIIKGDLNGDGALGVIDLIRLKSHMLNKSKLEGFLFKAGDFDKSGGSELTILDLLALKDNVINKPTAK